MKKLLAFVLTLCMIFALCACGEKPVETVSEGKALEFVYHCFGR